MYRKITLFIIPLIFSFFFIENSYAQKGKNLKPNITPIYFTAGFDGHLLSSATIKKGNNDPVFAVPRYTGFFHISTNMHYDFSNNVGAFLGLGIKNIGFIEIFKDVDSTVIRRTYSLTIPLGVKFGNFNRGNYGFIGGGIDLPFHYKEKGFVKRNDKTKYREWFSNRTEPVHPYVFVGAHLHPGLAIKLQYYPTNYMNTEYTTQREVAGVMEEFKPYQDYQVNLIVLSLGINIKYTPKPYWDK